MIYVVNKKRKLENVKKENFQLQFVYPNEQQRKNMRIIHRDMTQNELRNIKISNNSLADVASKIKNGEIQKEDLDEDTINILKDVLFS